MSRRGRDVAAALLAVYLLWGSTYFAIRLMVESAPPLLANGVRYTVAGVILAGYVAVRRPRALLVTRRELAAIALLGSVLLLGGNSMIVVAEQTVPSAAAALLFAAVPFWVVLLRRAHRERVARVTLVGVAVGFVGVAVIAAPGATGLGVGSGFLVFGSICWAVGSYYAPRLSLPADTTAATALEMIVGGVATALAGLAAGEAPTRLGELSTRSGGAFLFLVFGGAVFGFSAYRWLLDNAPVSTVATHAYVNPLVAVLLGTLILGERLSLSALAGGALVLAAVVLCVSEPRGRGRHIRERVAASRLAGRHRCDQAVRCRSR